MIIKKFIFKFENTLLEDDKLIREPGRIGWSVIKVVFVGACILIIFLIMLEVPDIEK